MKHLGNGRNWQSQPRPELKSVDHTKRNETKRNVFFRLYSCNRKNHATKCRMHNELLWICMNRIYNLRLPDANHQIIDGNKEILNRRYTVHSVKIGKCQWKIECRNIDDMIETNYHNHIWIAQLKQRATNLLQ